MWSAGVLCANILGVSASLITSIVIRRTLSEICVRLVLHDDDASRHDHKALVRHFHRHSCGVFNGDHVVLTFTERSSLLVESFGDLLLLLNTTVRVFLMTKYLSLGGGNGSLTVDAGSRPDYVSVCVLNFLFVGKVEAPFLCLLLVPGLAPSIDDIHESCGSLPGVLARVLVWHHTTMLHY